MKKLVALASCALLMGCTSVEQEVDTPELSVRPLGVPLPSGSTLDPAGMAPSQMQSSENIEGSLAPDDATPQERVPEIVERGRLIVGVDQSQNLLSFRDPVTAELTGFEIELAQHIAQDIFGTPDAVDFRFVDSGDRASALQSGEVDIIIRTMAITEERQEVIAFSTPYFSTTTRMLTQIDSGITDYEQLPGKTVCVADDTTSLHKARAAAPQSPILRTMTWSDCLMALQQRQVDAILSDTSILSGIAAQDPHTHIVGESLGSDVYGVGIRKPTPEHDSTGLVRQVNATMERIRTDGSWWEMYNKWFSPYLSFAAPPPRNYRQEENIDE